MSDFSADRRQMVERQLVPRAISDRRLLEAMSTVPRHLFVAPEDILQAYKDSPLAIGYGQTISQPYIVALMAQSALLEERAQVLEIGTGSGYGAAVLSHLCRAVYTVERIPQLAQESAVRLENLGYAHVHVKQDDGSLGWAEHAPYDAIIVTASAPQAPEALVDQLKVGGRLIAPVGKRDAQHLIRLTKIGEASYRQEKLGSVRFVPLIGEQGWP